MPSSSLGKNDLALSLLKAVGEIVNEKGARELSLRNVARRAGVSHASPGHHFGSKSGMLAAFARQGFDLLNAELKAAAHASRKCSPLEQFQADGEAYVRFAVSHPAHFEVMFRSGLNTPAHAEIHLQAEKTFAGLISRVQDLQAHGYFAEKDPKLAALHFWAAAHGLASLWLDGQLSPSMGMQDSALIAKQVMAMVMRTAQAG